MPEITHFPYPDHLLAGGQAEETPAVTAEQVASPQTSVEKPMSNVIAIGKQAEVGSYAELLTQAVQRVTYWKAAKTEASANTARTLSYPEQNNANVGSEAGQNISYLGPNNPEALAKAA